ncbi:phosphoadenosine phosphosulfate reductase family protein [Vibrio vulnificus]
MEQKIENVISNIQSLLRSGQSLSCSFSTGKDSTCVLILMLEAIKRMVADREVVPQCYVMTANTRREMPEMDNYAAWVLQDLQIYCCQHGYPVEVITVEPPLANRFMWTTIGRGKLPRYVGMSADCSVDEKIRPQQKLLQKLTKQNNGQIISLLGSRHAESSARSASMTAHKMDELTIVEVNGHKTFSPIADWETDDVWMLISGCSCYDGREPRYFGTFRPNFDALLELYRNANEGVCGVIVGEGGHRSGCGSRFGCSYCLKIGDRDRSLESLLDEDLNRYGYMAGLVKFRRFLLNIRWDMGRRDFRGRFMSEAGFIKVYADYLSPTTKRELLRYLLTLDVLEIERAKAMEEKYYSGQVEQTKHNLMLTQPMFQNVTVDDVLALDFCWSMSRDFIHEASPAARDFIDVHELGVRYHIPDIPESPKTAIPPQRWFDMREAVENVEGLKGLVASNGALHELHIKSSDQLEVEPGAGFTYVNAVRRNYYELNKVSPSEVCRSALHYGWLKMRQADLQRYDQIARRNDYIVKLMQKEPRIGMCPFSGDDKLLTVNEFLIENSISDAEHQKLLEDVERRRIEQDDQTDLFGAESILAMRKDVGKGNRRDVQKVKKNVSVESIVNFHALESQMGLFVGFS